MMTVAELTRRLESAEDMRRMAHRLRREADEAETQAYADAGIECRTNREPGFPNWSHAIIDGFYQDPFQALEAAIEHDKLHPVGIGRE